jgi:kynurenine formamidase
VLIDYYAYAKKNGKEYDPFEYHSISWDELYACGKDQEIDIRPEAQGGDIRVGDMLFVRSGWKEAFDAKSPEERETAALRHGSGKDGEDGQKYAGVSQEQKVLDWLHDSYFAAVAGDAPAFEAWPSHEPYWLHEYILALWGMPLGEMLDLEKLAKTCREKERWFFFFSSAPANCPGGVSSHVNGTAIF